MNVPELGDRYLAQTYRRFPLQITGGKGSVAYGSDGREYLDLGSGIGVNIFGYSDALWQAALTEQMAKFQHCSNLYHSAPAAQLAQMLCERSGMERVFFCNSGAEANECAIKTARKWAAEAKGPEYYHIITLKQSFHGRTLATLSATGQELYHRDYQPLLQGFVHVQAGDIQGLEQMVRQQPCAAILFECVQGEGGVMPIGRDYAQALQKIAREHHLLLIADEVQLGNGRSGRLYGYMNYGLEPDIVTTAKGLGGGLPIGAALLGQRVAQVLQPGSHGSTFGGNPLCCAGALNILSRIDDTLLSGVEERSAYIFRQLENTPGISGISGMGLMIGFEAPIPAADFAQKLLEAGVLVTTAKNKIRLLPALNIPMELLKKAMQIIQDCAK